MAVVWQFPYRMGIQMHIVPTVFCQQFPVDHGFPDKDPVTGKTIPAWPIILPVEGSEHGYQSCFTYDKALRDAYVVNGLCGVDASIQKHFNYTCPEPDMGGGFDAVRQSYLYSQHSRPTEPRYAAETNYPSSHCDLSLRRGVLDRVLDGVLGENGSVVPLCFLALILGSIGMILSTIENIAGVRKPESEAFADTTGGIRTTQSQPVACTARGIRTTQSQPVAGTPGSCGICKTQAKPNNETKPSVPPPLPDKQVSEAAPFTPTTSAASSDVCN